MDNREPELYGFDNWEPRLSRYFFHVRDAYGLILDEEGSEIAGKSRSVQEARAIARDLAKQCIDNGQLFSDLFIEIRNECGKIISTMRVADVVNNPGQTLRSPKSGRPVKAYSALNADDAQSEHRSIVEGFVIEQIDLDRRKREEHRRWNYLLRKIRKLN